MSELKCIKGESCLYCGSNYCRFVDELDQLKAENKKLKKEKKDLNKHYENQLGAVIKKYNDLLEKKENLCASNMRIRKGLREIREIANYSFDLSTSELLAKLEQILQKCEVLDE